VSHDVWSEEDPSESVRTYVRSIGDHARLVNRERAALLGDALLAASRGRLDEDGRATAAQLAHQLVGSAGTFGFPGASELAGELERFFDDGGFEDERRLALARHQLGALKRELAAEPRYRPDQDQSDHP
jgi:HPt (histidine-containing phosphotransfer) domain-containing protein